jgi:hypothetical protein
VILGDTRGREEKHSRVKCNTDIPEDISQQRRGNTNGEKEYYVVIKRS